jgi:DNA-binding CsgD family transcriptional regulator
MSKALQERNKLIGTLYRGGLRQAEIARKLGLSRERIHQILLGQGAKGVSTSIKLDTRAALDLFKKGRSIQEIADVLGVHSERVAQAVKAQLGEVDLRARWQALQLKCAEERMSTRGVVLDYKHMGLNKIAAKYHCSVDTVKLVLQRRGIAIKPRGRPRKNSK